MATLLQTQGKLAEAEPLCREALAGERETLGDKHPRTLISIGNMAELLRTRGKLAEAEALFCEAYKGRSRKKKVSRLIPLRSPRPIEYYAASSTSPPRHAYVITPTDIEPNECIESWTAACLDNGTRTPSTLPIALGRC